MFGTLTSPDPAAATALADLLPGYDHQDHAGRRAAWIAHVARLADSLHRELLSRADALGVPISATERAELQTSCLDGGPVRVWHCPVPLTLLDTIYCPVGHAMPPTDPGSLVIWQRPSLEVAYLYSVADLWAVTNPLGAPSHEPELTRAVTIALSWVRHHCRPSGTSAAA